MIKRIKGHAIAALGIAAFCATDTKALTVDFSSAPAANQSSPGASIHFDGSSDTFTFIPAAASGRHLRITSTDGTGSSVGLLGDLAGTFTIGTITASGIVQSAPVTGPGTIEIFDGTTSLTASVSWNTIFTLSSFGGLNAGGSVNLTGITYTGTNPELQSLASSATDTGTATITFQFVPAKTLTELTANGAVHETSFSGSLTVANSSGSIGNFVWRDENASGIQDSGEPGIDGVNVILRDGDGNALATTTTASNGYYQFTMLPAGTYLVTLDHTSPALAGLFSSPVSAFGSTTANDSNSELLPVVLPTNTSSDQTIDFGFHPFIPPTGRIGDYVWLDIDQDGIQDAGESGINGVTVRLKDNANNVLFSTVTAGNGAYLFTDLAAGNYVVEIDGSSGPLAGLVPTIENAPGSTLANDSETNEIAVNLPSDSSQNLDADFGFIPTPAGSIGDFVWQDLNGDGIQGSAADEPGVDGITIELFGPNGLHQTQVTAGGGYYLFTGLTAGNYTVVAPGTLNIGGFTYNPTTVNAPGSNTANDSNPLSSAVNLPLNTSSDTSIDFGYTPVPAGRLGDFVWNDLNDNGIQDSGEPGINGVTVRLLDTSDVEIDSTVTAGNGAYLFTGLSGGTIYKVEVDLSSPALAGFVPGTVNAVGSTTANDSNPNPTTVTLPGNTSSDLTIDFGFVVPSGAIGNFVWKDLDEDGVQDAGEPGINGVTVQLFGPGNVLLASTATAGNGAYLFSGLTAGTYTVAVDESSPALSGFFATLTGTGTTATDSNTNPTTVILPNNITVDDTVDFGYIEPTGRIGDFVWFDTNENGIQDSGEPGINGVTVRLLGPGNVVLATTVTAGNGAYLFTGLMAGTYTVAVDNSSLALNGLITTQPGAAGSTPANDSNAIPATTVLPTHSSADLTLDFGYIMPPEGSIGDFVWDDLDRDGLQDVGEPGIAGVTVSLFGPGNVLLAATLTDVDGFYLFEGLHSGTYTVAVNNASAPLANYSPTIQVPGNPATDSNVNPAVVVLPANNSSDITIDFGFVENLRGQIGNYVWKDLNSNGIQDSGEPGLNGVTVKLYSGDGDLLATTTTSGGGLYLFTGLGAGDYSVEVDPSSPALAGLDPATANAPGSNLLNDSNPNPSDVTLPTNSSIDLSVDFGYTPRIPSASGRIGNFVWKDLNANGRQDAGEPGINGVPVTLKDSIGNIIATQVTSGNGGYLFSGLAAGNYSVEVNELDPDLAGLIPTLDYAAGTTTANDSNANPYGVTLATSSSEDLTVDFGFIPPGCACIGNRVWKDLDEDGIQDCNEPGIRNVTVKLYWNGTLIATTVTDSQGYYSFRGLWTGCFTVVIDNNQSALTGLTPTRVQAGSNRATDSNPNPATVCLTSSSSHCSCGSCDSTIDFGYKCVPPPRPITTYTQGGWGACPSGNNPGTLLKNNWSLVYPSGLTVGGSKTLKFTSASAIANFLPSGGTAAALRQNYINPTTKLGVLAGQVVALRLNVDFSNKGVTAPGLASMKFKSGSPFAGKTVAQVLALAESCLGGAALPSGVSYTTLSDACALVNENFDNGVNKGNLVP